MRLDDRRPPIVLAWCAGAALLVSCTEDSPNVLDPRGPAAARIEGLWWLMLWISAAVFVVVLAMLGVAWRRGGSPEPGTGGHVAWGEPFVALAGVIVPAVVLAAVFVVSLRDMSALSAPDKPAALTIDVVGNDWWWEVVYDSPSAVTANEIHIPVGQPVRLRLTTNDVIHSFWVPQLQAKTDMIPGDTNGMWLQADEPGRYRGQCAEFCGLQHAQMIFYVVAQPRAEFERWLEDISAPAPKPAGANARRGEDVFLNSTCVGCHAVRGTQADARLGPDLTHLADRRTIAAGVLTNTRANLALWITNPQDVKPGAAMPPTDLTEEELDALLDYLLALK